MGQHIGFGVPLAFHDRSPHNLYRDLEQELPWIQQTDEYVKVLRGLKPRNDSYLVCFSDVANGLNDWFWPDTYPGGDDARKKLKEGMWAWLMTFDRLGAL